MKISKLLFAVLVLSIGFSIIKPDYGYAVDELYLTGVLKDVDYQAKKVTVDVQSATCHGVREFSIEYPYELKESEGKIISFKIESSTCKDKDNEVHKIFPAGRK